MRNWLKRLKNKVDEMLGFAANLIPSNVRIKWIIPVIKELQEYIIFSASFELLTKLPMIILCISYLGQVFNKMVDFFYVSIYGCVLVYGIRIIFRGYNLKKLNYAFVKDGQIDVLKDNEQRAYQVGDIVCGLILSFLCMIDRINDIVIFLILMLLIIFTLAYLSIKYNLLLLKVLTVFSGSIGSIIIMIITVLALFFLSESMASATLYEVMDIVHNTYIEVFDMNIWGPIILCISYLGEKMPTVTIGLIIITLLFYCFYIHIMPVNQIKKLTLAFKIFNTFMVLSGIIFFWVSPYIASEIKAALIEIPNATGPVPDEIIEYINLFSQDNIDNITYLFGVPYTLGLVIANYMIDHVIIRNEKIIDNILDELSKSKDISKSKVSELEKKYFYYGGKKYLLDIVKKTCYE